MVEPRRTLLVTVDNFPMASLIRDRLSAEGIVCLMVNVGDQMAGDMTTRGGLGPFAFQYEIWVAEKDVDDARRIAAV